MKCKCCERTINNARMGICFDCASCESVIAEGLDMFDEPIQKVEGYSSHMAKLKYVLKKFGIVKQNG